MSEWNHRVCERCWFNGGYYPVLGEGRGSLRKVEAVQGDFDGYRQPVQVSEPEPGPCCFCGGMTITGIYVRRDPLSDDVLCEGQHDVQQWGSWSFVGVPS